MYFPQCRVNICYLIFYFYFLLPVPEEYMLPFSRDCLASRDMTVAFRVWLSGRYDFRRNGITVLLCGLKYFIFLSSAGVTLY